MSTPVIPVDENPYRLPWRCRERHEYDSIILDCDGNDVCAFVGRIAYPEEYVVAAVNACAGLDLLDLERIPAGGLSENRSVRLFEALDLAETYLSDGDRSSALRVMQDALLADQPNYRRAGDGGLRVTTPADLAEEKGDADA